MRIGIDIDDTITNTYDCTLKVISEIYNIDYKELLNKKMYYNELNELYPLAFSKEIYKKQINKVSLKDNAKKIINKLSKNNEIIIITARNKNECDIPYNLSYEYLKKNKIKFDELIVEAIDKGKICFDKKIDLLIDDSINNCKSAAIYEIDTLLFDNVYNKESKINRIKNWNQIYKYIERKNNAKNNIRRTNRRR